MATEKKQADAKLESAKTDADQVVPEAVDQGVPQVGKVLEVIEDAAITPTHIRVRARPGIERFCRGGRRFGAEATTLKINELSDEQFQAITAEEMLVVEFVLDETPQADD